MKKNKIELSERLDTILPLNIVNPLKHANIVNVGELVNAIKFGKLSFIRGIGPKKIDIIIDVFKKKGIKSCKNNFRYSKVQSIVQFVDLHSYTMSYFLYLNKLSKNEMYELRNYMKRSNISFKKNEDIYFDLGLSKDITDVLYLNDIGEITTLKRVYIEIYTYSKHIRGLGKKYILQIGKALYKYYTKNQSFIN